ncbi:hypothetical protein ACFQJC_00255 [Haloferax namakaokahaiae]|uniref:DUF7988 domain-containing protein n=1 Tax=Haloferax namakaokahaiae TaxID=1748331 RepID=A0ABD5Z9L5_9EURY
MTAGTPPETPPLEARFDDARRVLEDEHSRLITVVRQCADAVAESWSDEFTTDREQVVPRFAQALDGSGALSRLPGALADAVTATGRPMPAPPVAAPPYVVVTSEGVVLRATVGDERLVITLRVFALETEGEEKRYTRTPDVELEFEAR